MCCAHYICSIINTQNNPLNCYSHSTNEQPDDQRGSLTHVALLQSVTMALPKFKPPKLRLFLPSQRWSLDESSLPLPHTLGAGVGEGIEDVCWL